MTRRRQSGAALIFALVALLVVATAAAALDLRTVHLARENVAERERLSARAAAQGGIERARWSLAHDSAYVGETLRVGERNVVVRVEADPADPALRRVRASSSPAAVTAVLRLRGGVVAGIVSWRED
jgi:hypothetical protein